jgi:hypothetical protein
MVHMSYDINGIRHVVLILRSEERRELTTQDILTLKELGQYVRCH